MGGKGRMARTSGLFSSHIPGWCFSLLWMAVMQRMPVHASDLLPLQEHSPVFLRNEQKNTALSIEMGPQSR
jgi:hypothetical protein